MERRALFDCVADDAEEISFQKGDVIVNVGTPRRTIGGVPDLRARSGGARYRRGLVYWDRAIDWKARSFPGELYGVDHFAPKSGSARNSARTFGRAIRLELSSLIPAFVQ